MSAYIETGIVTIAPQASAASLPWFVQVSTDGPSTGSIKLTDDLGHTIAEVTGITWSAGSATAEPSWSGTWVTGSGLIDANGTAHGVWPLTGWTAEVGRTVTLAVRQDSGTGFAARLAVERWPAEALT